MSNRKKTKSMCGLRDKFQENKKAFRFYSRELRQTMCKGQLPVRGHDCIRREKGESHAGKKFTGKQNGRYAGG